MQVRVGNADGAAGELDAVEHKVICFCAHVGLIRFQIVEAFVHRRGEGVVHGDERFCLLIPLEEGEFRDPEEVVLILRDDIELFRHFVAQCAEGGEDV